MEQVRHRGAKLTRGTISVLLGRLSKNNHIILKEHSKANNNGGSAYRVLKSGLNALMKSSLTKTPSDSLTKTTLVSKSVVNTTTTDKTLIEKLEEWVRTSSLETHGIGMSDLLPLYRKSVVRDEVVDHETFHQSLRHLAFYLQNAELSKGLRHPKTWAIGQLREGEGFFARPAGYLSPAEKRQKEILEAKKAELRALEAMKKEEEALNFQIWVAKTQPEALQEILPTGIKHTSQAGQQILREYFLETQPPM